MIWSFLVLAAAAVLAFVISTRSRLLALCTTAAGGLTVAYFFMPPDYSLRVENPEDTITLLAYGTGGILLTHAGARRRRSRVSRAVDTKEWPVASRLRRTCTAAALGEAMASWDARLRKQGIQVRCGALPFPQVSQPHDDVVRVFSDIIRATLETDGVRGAWLHSVQLPGRQLFIWCVETGRRNGARGMLVAGGPDGAGEPVLFPGWPSSVRATAVDNGSERIYQVTFS